MLSPIVSRSWFGRARGVASDLLIAIAVIWTLPLLLSAVAAVLRLLLQRVW
jgi:hypothetical protein